MKYTISYPDGRLDVFDWEEDFSREINKILNRGEKVEIVAVVKEGYDTSR